jgi:hypothetical protein
VIDLGDIGSYMHLGGIIRVHTCLLVQLDLTAAGWTFFVLLQELIPELSHCKIAITVGCKLFDHKQVIPALNSTITYAKPK